MDGATDVEGRVEICFSRRWGTISGNGWTHRESTVVCNDLGYETTGMLRQTLTHKPNGALSDSFLPCSLPDMDYSVRPVTNSMPVYMKDVRCTGREPSLLECGFKTNLTHTDHFGDVGIKCKKCKL